MEVETPDQRVPYDVDHLHCVYEPGHVTVMYIPDPDKASDPRPMA